VSAGLPNPPNRELGDPLPNAAVKAVGYLRRSTERQEQSLGDQRAAIEAYALDHGYTVLRFYVDDAVSGTESSRRRAFQQMIADAQKPRRDFDLILVYDVKRFGRVDNDEAGHYRWLLRKRGVQVVYTAEGFVGTSIDDLLRPVKQWQAREESKDLSKLSIRGMLSRLRRDQRMGFWLGGFPPHGYDLWYETDTGRFRFTVRYMQDGTKLLLDSRGVEIETLPRRQPHIVVRTDRCRLVPSSTDRVAVVQRVFRMVGHERVPVERVARTLNSEGVATSRGPGWSDWCSGMWGSNVLRTMLSNPAYCGDLAWNKRTLARFHRVGLNGAEERTDAAFRRTSPNPRAIWIVTRDTHEPLVSRADWELAHEMLRHRSRRL